MAGQWPVTGPCACGRRAVAAWCARSKGIGLVRSVAWSGDGHWLASGAVDRTVRVWEASSGRLVRTLEGHQGWVRSVAWSGMGNGWPVAPMTGPCACGRASSGRLVRTLEGHQGCGQERGVVRGWAMAGQWRR